MLNNPFHKWFTLCMCRGSDPDRAPKFFKALNILGSEGIMGDLNDGPEQFPLSKSTVWNSILMLLPKHSYDLIITHSPFGEYTKHIRHEEIGKAVITLWGAGRIKTSELWVFAYEDGANAYLPRAIPYAPLFQPLTDRIWKEKYSIIREIYGFEENSFEALTTPRSESFWRFLNSKEAVKWQEKVPN